MFAFPKMYHNQGFTRDASEQRHQNGGQAAAFLMVSLYGSGDIAKPSLLSKEGGNLEMSPAHPSTCIGHRTNS